MPHVFTLDGPVIERRVMLNAPRRPVALAQSEDLVRSVVNPVLWSALAAFSGLVIGGVVGYAIGKR